MQGYGENDTISAWRWRWGEVEVYYLPPASQVYWLLRLAVNKIREE